MKYILNALIPTFAIATGFIFFKQKPKILGNMDNDEL